MVHQKCIKTKLPRKPRNARQGPPRVLGGLPDATPFPAYLGVPPQLEPTTALFTLCYNAAHRNYFTNLQKGRWGGPPAPPAQRASTSESLTCTSTASCGDPSTCRVEHTGEWPPTMVSESDCRSSKARGCSSSIMDPHSHNHLCGSAPSPVSPCSSKLVGSSSSHSSASSCSSPSGSSSSYCVCSSSSSEGESSAQPRRRQAPSLAMQSASWGTHGTKFASATAILSSTQLRSLVTPWAGTHSASSLVALYAKKLPLKMRPHAAHK